MQITVPVIIAMVNAIVALLILYLVLSGRLEGVLKAMSRYVRVSRQGTEPMRLKDFAKGTKGKTWDSVKKRE